MRCVLLLTLLAGCAANQSAPTLTVAHQRGLATTSQPAADAAPLDVQQLSGQLVAGVQAALHTELQATGVGGDVAGYRSEFGIGAVIVVTLALVLSLVLSHRREMTRIRQNGKHGPSPAGVHR